MPTTRTAYYHFGGVQSVLIWTEEEMAGHLKITVEALREAIKAGRFCYHVLEDGRYLFNEESLVANVRRSGIASATP